MGVPLGSGACPRGCKGTGYALTGRYPMMLTLLLTGCQLVQGLLGDASGALATAEAKLKAGDVAAAAQAYEAGLKDHPGDADLASGAAYCALLAGNTAAADTWLAGAEANAGPKLGAVKVRRALVAIEAGDLDRARTYALESNEPVGRLIAGEVSLADGDRDAAKEQLEIARTAGGAVGDTASRYLALIADPNVMVAGLSETQALWALGDRRIAVRSVGDLVKAYAESHEDGPEQLLVWAGRAAAAGEPGVAYDLLDAITVAPPGQAWRLAATRAVALCAEGRGEECRATLDGLGTIAPADAVADARATAAMAIARTDPTLAKTLIDGYRGDAVARAWAELGDAARGAAVADDPFFKMQLGG